ncbi:MAG: citrate/2-methylcitrate synthase, partial [SAR324 cluster bacterium]|nr:citrate/2-methylcitrate synthase [SAR324 cluster bacterium]
MPETAILQLPDQSIELPLLTGTEDEKAVDISKLRAQTGYITLDTGFMNTGSCTSAVTFLDGEKGILRYRGYPIEQLAEHSSFVEVSYLLIYGELPTQEQLASFSKLLSQHSLIHEGLKQVFGGFSKSAHPMVILSAMVASLSAYYSEASGKASVENLDINGARLLAKIRTIAAFSYKKTIGQPFIYPTDSLAYVPNFLNMMFAVPAEPYEIHPDVARALELLLILHADHEQNCSTSTVRVVGSSMANVYASVASGILALWGPLHGGANQAVLEMLAQIQNDGGDVDKFIKLGKDPDSGFRLM